MAIDTKKVGRVVFEYFLLTVGTLLYCLPWDWFVIPNEYSSGGVTGLLTLLQYVTNGAIPVGTSYLVVNVFLLILAFFVLGKGFGVKTIYCIAASTLFFEILPHFESMYCIEGGYLFLPNDVLIPLIAGAIEGVGLGMVLKYGGSTGGSDIFAMIINKYWPVSPGRFYLISDAIIIALVLLLPGKTFADMIYGYLMMITSACLVDVVVVGTKSSVQVLIFSEKSDEIADYLMYQLDKGVTALHATGCYKKQDKDVLVVILRKRGLGDLTAAVKEIDKDAFVSVAAAESVYGEGFEEIKSGLNRKKTTKKD